MYKKILVPLDGSEFAEDSLEYARAIAETDKGTEIVLLRVMEPDPQLADIGGVSSEQWFRRAQAKAQAKIKEDTSQVANKLEKEGLKARGIVRSGRAADEILGYAESNQVDLIVMRTHGRSGISRWVLGSVADKVLHHSAIPMLILGPCANGVRVS